MTYTIRISGDSPQAKSIVDMLKSLQKDYTFIEINDNTEYPENDLSSEWLEEIDRRAAYLEKHPNEGKTWDEIKQNLLKNAR